SPTHFGASFCSIVKGQPLSSCRSDNYYILPKLHFLVKHFFEKSFFVDLTTRGFGATTVNRLAQKSGRGQAFF
ncbi:hypothetical protein, partial [Atopobacter sp. AH10]|uniref:hypothetical protein n=1 Tax=Atopobacter sp. AH10 TaxID=2315861 RepID=UPI001F2742E5